MSDHAVVGAADSADQDVCDPELRDMPQPPVHEVADLDPTSGGTDPGIFGADITAYGFVPLHRRFKEQWWWQHKPWSYAQLFLWLLMVANFKPRQADFNGQIISVPRGAVATSKLALSDRSGLSRNTVDRFITKMARAGEIKVLQCGHNGIVVSLCRYEEYTAVPQRTAQRAGSRRGTQRYNRQAAGGQSTLHTSTRNTMPTQETTKQRKHGVSGE